MLVTISSVRGSPGVTSWALLLAAAWPPGAPDDRAVLEADCAGGVLGARYQLGVEPGAVTLVSACRRRGDSPAPGHHGRPLTDGVWAVPGPEVAERAVPVWTSGAGDVADVLGDDDRLWLADLGRAGPGSPVEPLIGASAANVVVTGPAIEDVVQVPARVAALSASAPTGVLVAGRCDFSEDELHRFFGGRALWAVPGTDRLPEVAMRAVQGGRARRSGPWRAATEVASDLAMLCRSSRRPSTERSADPGCGLDGDQAADDAAGRCPPPTVHPLPPRPDRSSPPSPTAEPAPEPASGLTTADDRPDPSGEAPADHRVDPLGDAGPPDDDRAAVLSPAMRAALDHRRRGRLR